MLSAGLPCSNSGVKNQNRVRSAQVLGKIGRMSALIAGTLLAACTVARREQPEPPPTVRFERADWRQIPGWESDATIEAWPALLESCTAIRSRPEWQAPCAAAAARNPGASAEVRDFFRAHFSPWRVLRVIGHTTESTGLVTGYYEPLLRGSREPLPPYGTPLYARPEDLLVVDLADVHPELAGKRVRGRLDGNRVVPFYTREQLPLADSLRGREIVWVDSALDAFLLEVQGSGRVQLASGETIRLQYADQNGQPYRAIGRYLVDQGIFTVEQVTIPVIRAWLDANPHRLREVLNSNPSVVFFSEEPLADPGRGPKGALGVPLTAGRSIAIDPAFVPLGAPIFLSTTYPATALPLERLVMAQDTGGAIRGIARADLFWGFGASAGQLAGTMRQDGQMWLLWPKDAPPP